jgi:hypothetical protein
MADSSNWLSLVCGRGSGNSGNAQSNYVGFRILSGGGISFGGNSSSIIFGNSSSVGDISLGGSSNGVDGGVIDTRNGMGINISGAGGSGHGGSGGFFVDNGSGHGSSHLANNISKSSSYTRISLGLGYMSIIILICFTHFMLSVGLNVYVFMVYAIL